MASRLISLLARHRSLGVRHVAKSKSICAFFFLISFSFSFRFLIISAILAYCAIFPIIYFFIGPDYITWLSKTDLSYGAIMYYLVFNTIVLIGFGYCVVGCVAYPYSSNYFNKSQKRQTNQRFGLEFTKCAERVVRVL